MSKLEHSITFDDTALEARWYSGFVVESEAGHAVHKIIERHGLDPRKIRTIRVEVVLDDREAS
jgi:hypothetical protein